VAKVRCSAAAAASGRASSAGRRARHNPAFHDAKGPWSSSPCRSRG
jgi:hypothetical protein